MKPQALLALNKYPSGFPQPLKQAYSMSYKQNVSMTKMQNGWTRKRVVEDKSVRTVNLAFMT